MSEINERNLRDAGVEAAENPERESRAAEEAPRKAAKPSSGKKRGGKKKNRRNGAIVPLAVALVVVLVIFGALVGYGLGRVRGAREGNEAEPQTTASAVEPAYDAFTEVLTQENESALEALSGQDEGENADLSMLRGEDGFFTDDEAESSEAAPVVVAEYGDGKQVMSDEVLDEYNDQMAIDILSGHNEEDVAEPLLMDAIEAVISERVQEEHARELGLYELNEEDRAQIATRAQADYAEWVKFYRESEIGGEGMSDAEIEAAAEASLLENEGISLESITEDLEAGWWEQKLFDYITADVTVDDEAVRESYEARLAEQRADFTEYPIDFEFAQWDGEIVLYNLPGYRAVKMLLLGFDDELTQMAVDELTDEFNLLGEDAGDEGDRQAELDGYYAGPEARAREALEQLRNGADMDELILSIGEDDGMKNDRQRAMGYYISADSSQSRALVDAAMALENVGDYSEPVRTESGVCILQYIGDVPEGDVPLSEVREELGEEVLSEARNAAYTEQVQTWLEEAAPTYYPERMQ